MLPLSFIFSPFPSSSSSSPLPLTRPLKLSNNATEEGAAVPKDCCHLDSLGDIKRDADISCLGDAARTPVGEAVGDRLGDAIGDHLEDFLGDILEEAVGDLVNNRFGDLNDACSKGTGVVIGLVGVNNGVVIGRVGVSSNVDADLVGVIIVALKLRESRFKSKSS